MLAHRLNPRNEGDGRGKRSGVFDIVARHEEEGAAAL